ncbi:TonB-dependent receptor, partial [Microcoleus sp. herbarium19]|uniref:TonB-dependent receptor n=1 Tax=unclassified Microcoleus TaxID=2642155 RepID=UPI002FD41527
DPKLSSSPPVPLETETVTESNLATSPIIRVSDLPPTATTVQEWRAQADAAIVKIIGVKIAPTEQGIDITLETEAGTILATPTTRTQGQTFYTNIPNAVLSLAEGNEFKVENPAAGIASISVTQVSPTFVQVLITGVDRLPRAQVSTNERGLVISSTLSTTMAESDDEIDIVVTGDRDAYRVPNSSVGTRTDTPLRDIPQSIQVVPQQVIKEQGASRLIEVLQNVPGVVQGFRSPRRGSNEFNIRGFYSGSNLLLNGSRLRVGTGQPILDFSPNIDRVEVLKGPASVLFGSGELGGTVNFVTKQPLRDPYAEIEFSAGNFNAYRGAIDLSEPLNDSRTVLYRLNASAQTTESFVDFYEQQRYSVAPTLSWQISDQTKLTLEAEYRKISISGVDYGLPIEGTILPNPNGRIPRNRYLGEPSYANTEKDIFLISSNLEHNFSANWQLRNIFRYTLTDEFIQEAQTSKLLADQRTMTRFSFEIPESRESAYELDSYVIGKFKTGSIQHQLVTGVNLFKQDRIFDFRPTSNTPPDIDIFSPTYARFVPTSTTRTSGVRDQTEGLGLYLQNQITLAENLKILLGGRFDIVGKDSEDLVTATSQFQQDEAFSPRIGIVYQPIQPISLYASYSRSFNPQAGISFNGDQFDPQRGTQYEIGIKADVNERLAATVAFYNLTRSNVLTTDPANPNFSIQTGEQRSRGIEFDISGEILPGWNIIAGYALNDATITKDNTLTVGNQLDNAPRNAFNVWTTYEIQSGNLQGLGFGLGLFYVGERQGDLANSFELPSYTRTDAAIFYNRDNFRVAINIKNLFDIDYFASSQSRTRVYYGDSLTVVGTVSWQF